MTRTVMWEAKAADGRAEELLGWVLEHADPAAEVYRSADGRVVVIDHNGRQVAEPPVHLLGRPPHVWSFERVSR